MSTLKNAEINAKDVNCSAKTAFQQKLKEMSNIITWQNLFKLLTPLPFFFFFLANLETTLSPRDRRFNV